MKKIIIIIALYMLLKPVIPVLEYLVFYDYIKSELCENKDKVEMHCNGMCYLAKELAKASDAEKDTKNKKNISIEIALVFCQEIQKDFVLHMYFITTKSNISAFYNTLYTHLCIASLLRPPIQQF